MNTCQIVPAGVYISQKTNQPVVRQNGRHVIIQADIEGSLNGIRLWIPNCSPERALEILEEHVAEQKPLTIDLEADYAYLNPLSMMQFKKAQQYAASVAAETAR